MAVFLPSNKTSDDEIFSKFLFGYDDDDNNNSIQQRGKVRILCIDGGPGVTGLLPAKALAYLERSLQSHSSNPQARISDYFDIAAGTAAGALFVSMLFSSPHPADATCRFISHNSSSFLKKQPSSSGLLSCLRSSSSSSSSSSTNMERALKDAVGDTTTLSNTVKPVLIPCYDIRTGSPFVFSRADALESPSFDFRLWEVCRATWTDPARFHPADIRSVDGATACLAVDGAVAAMSNPAAVAVTHVLHNKQEFPFVRGVEDIILLSLGCGAPTYHNPRRYATRIASDGAADLVDNALALAFGRSNNYVRIQADGTTMSRCGADADCNHSPGNVKALLASADEMLKQKNVESVMFAGKRIGEQTNMEKLDWLARELVLEQQRRRRRRSCRIPPTVAFKQPRPNHKS